MVRVKRHPRSAGQCDDNRVCGWQRPHQWGVAGSEADGVRLNEALGADGHAPLPRVLFRGVRPFYFEPPVRIG